MVPPKNDSDKMFNSERNEVICARLSREGIATKVRAVQIHKS